MEEIFWQRTVNALNESNICALKHENPRLASKRYGPPTIQAVDAAMIIIIIIDVDVVL